MKTLAFNRRAKFDYQILEIFEAGLVLQGTEVRAAKEGKMSIKGSFVRFINNEPFLINSHIGPHKHTREKDQHQADRTRKALLHKAEIKRLLGKTKEKGLTLVPLRVYNKKGKLKLEFAIGRGKSKIDKRETIKKREIARRIRKEEDF